jgi:hypothetical protein
MKRFLHYAKWLSIIAALIYLLLLIPDRQPTIPAESSSISRKQAFVWNQDQYWEALEAKYRDIQKTGCEHITPIVESKLAQLNAVLNTLRKNKVDPDSEIFAALEQRMFEIGPIIGGCRAHLSDYVHFITDMRDVVKRQSEHWDMNSDAARITLYRLLYGGRTAVEEIMMQIPAGSLPGLITATDEPSQTPSARIRNVIIHSGDILVSRGGAPTSALIARGSDYPGNFSHIAFVYIDPQTHEAKIVESHIERGVVASSIEEYIEDKKLRVMLLRPRADLPQIMQDPMIPHKAAEFAFQRVTSGHVPYDFEMDYKDHSKLFCSEVASAAYEQYGIHLWAGISTISSPGLRRWLAGFGVTHFETQEPSDLEYDPQLRVVAEWRDPETLRKDRMDNAVTEFMLEGAEKGDELSYQWYLLPIARLVKAYSMILNHFGKVGPIPEGMSATAGLRTTYYDDIHDAIGEKLALKADSFRIEHGYEAPYWELVKLARSAKEETE